MESYLVKRELKLIDINLIHPEADTVEWINTIHRDCLLLISVGLHRGHLKVLGTTQDLVTTEITITITEIENKHRTDHLKIAILI